MSSIPSGGPAAIADDARSVLRNHSFRNLLWASATSSMGDWIGLFALLALAETLEGASRAGALAVTVIMIARIVPTLVLAPVAGVFVDRWDRKRTLIVTDVVRGGIMLLIPFVGDVFQLVTATLVIEVAAALFIPAKDATVPTIVRREQLTTANQLSLLSTYSTLPLGALICAVVIGVTEGVASPGTFFAERPEAVPILLNAVSFFVSMLFVQRMDVPTDNVRVHREQDESSAWRELREGLEFIASKPLIRALVVGVMAAFLAAGIVIGVGKFFATITNAGEAGFSLLGFFVGVGLVGGILGVRRLERHVARERLFAPGIVLAGVALVVAALMPTLTAVALPVLLMGAGAGVSFVTGYTMLHEYSSDEVRGRTFAAFNTGVRAALFAALVIGPAALAVLGVERTEEQIASGDEVDDLDELDPTTGEGIEQAGVYPYQIGGVRLTLMAGGAVAIIGGVWCGWQIAGALRRSAEDDQDGVRDGGPAAGALPGGALSARAPSAESDQLVDAPPDHPGLFVVFEGGDGAGKSTQARLLADAVRRAGHECVVTREPGGTPVGEQVRDLVLSPRWQVEPRAEALLYAAARAQHVDEVLRPALDRGAVVVSDRFVDSSIVYQGEGRDLGRDVVGQLNMWATAGLQPDLVVVLDVDPAVGLGRITAGGEHGDRLERAGDDFHRAVNDAFRSLADGDPDRYLVLDAADAVDQLHAQVRERVGGLLTRGPSDRVASGGGEGRVASRGDEDRGAARFDDGPRDSAGARQSDGGDPGPDREAVGSPGRDTGRSQGST